jgi:hypothetical protein
MSSKNEDPSKYDEEEYSCRGKLKLDVLDEAHN